MTAPLLVAAACLVLWWPPTRSEFRVRDAGPPRTRARRPTRWMVMVGAPVTALLLSGVAAGVAIGIIAAVVAWRMRRRARATADDRARADLLAVLSLMIAELSVGSPPARAAATAAQEVSQTGAGSTVGPALAVLAGRAELGGSVLDDIGEQGPDTRGEGSSGAAGAENASWKRIAVAWQTSERYGLPMGDLLAAVQADLVARRAFADRTRAGMAGPRATVTVLAGLPLLGIGLGQAIGARPVQTLLGGGLGGMLLVVGTTLAAVGIVWSERITDKVVAP